MTIAEEFHRTVLTRIYEAVQLTGYSFYGLIKLIEGGAEAAARRLIFDSDGDFQQGLIVLYEANLLHLSVEHAVIEFGERGELFTIDEVEIARGRLQTIRLLVG